MATSKLGTLVYDLVADTKGFQQGIFQSRREITALKKLFLETRTPLEAFGIELQGMQRLIEGGNRPLNMFSRAIVELAHSTEGGVTKAREFIKSLRSQSTELISAAGSYRNVSEADKKRIKNMRAAATVIENELNLSIKARKESDLRSIALQKETEHLRKKAEGEKIVADRRSKAVLQAKSDAVRQEASQLAAVRRELERTIPPRQRLVALAASARAEYAAGNITQQELLVIQKSLAAQIRELNPEYQQQQERLARVRSGLNNLITPQQRIRQQVRELREEYRAGNVTYDDTVKRMRQLREEHRKLGVEQDKEEQKRSRFVQGLRNQTFALVRQISAITLMYKAIRQLQEGFADALEIGRSERQFETFTGSATVASRLMTDIRQFTAETPVTLGAAQQAVRTLLQYNVDQDEVINRLRQLGDISGGSTESLQRLSLAFGQITANTRLQGQELRQLIEAGFNPLQVISEQTGETMFDLRQRMADGTISFKEVGEALDSATSDAGRFANALENIATETDFGRLQRFRSEFEKLRADIMIPISAAIGAAAGESLDQLDEYRSQVRERLVFDPDADLQAKELDKYLRLLDVFGGIPMIPLEAKKRMIDAVIKEQRRAIKASQAQVTIELKELLAANESQTVSNSEVEDSIHKKIAALRKEADALRLGADEALVQELRKQGASNDYIAQLRKEMKIVDDLKSKQKEQDDAEKKLHDERLKRIRERELAEKRAIQDRERDLANQKKQAEAMAETIMTPLERLEQELSEIQKLSRFLTVQQRVKLMDKAKERFEADLAGRNRSDEAAAVTRGSVEEFKLVAQINKTQVSQQQRLHDEAQGERKKTNTKLDLQIKALDLLPLELGEEMASLMAESVS